MILRLRLCAATALLGAILSGQAANGQILANGNPDAAYSGLELWLRADAGVYSDAGTTLAANTNSVQQWNNQATAVGAAGHAMQANATLRGTYLSSAINGRAAVQFDGVNDFMQGTASLGGAKTIFAVMKDIGTTNTCCAGGIYTNTSGNATTSNGLETRKNLATNKREMFLDYAGSSLSGPSDVLNRAVVASVTYAPTGSTLRLDGVTEITEAANRTAAANLYQLATRNNELGRYSNSQIAETLIFDGSLTTFQRFQVEQYLGDKYGIAVARPIVDEQFTNTNQVVTNAFGDDGEIAAAVNFHNNTGLAGAMGSSTILGIGFDDVFVGEPTATNGTRNLTANASGVTLTTNFERFLDREAGNIAIGGADGANASRLVADIHTIGVGESHEFTVGGLNANSEVFVQLFGGDSAWGADLDVLVNGDLIGRWTTVADGSQTTASTYGFFAETDALGRLLFDLNAINVGGPGNPNFAGLSGFIITQALAVPEPSAVLVWLAGSMIILSVVCSSRRRFHWCLAVAKARRRPFVPKIERENV